MKSSPVSIHPYFQIHSGSYDAVMILLRQFTEKTQREERCHYYEFTVHDDIVFCREAYAGAEGALAHLENVGEELATMLQLCDLIRLELHGPAGELDKLRGPLAELKPVWFATECGIDR